jgi:hypothetical protein
LKFHFIIQPDKVKVANYPTLIPEIPVISQAGKLAAAGQVRVKREGPAGDGPEGSLTTLIPEAFKKYLSTLKTFLEIISVLSLITLPEMPQIGCFAQICPFFIICPRNQKLDITANRNSIIIIWSTFFSTIKVCERFRKKFVQILK